MKDFYEQFTTFLVNGIKMYAEFYEKESQKGDREMTDFYQGKLVAYQDILVKFYRLHSNTTKKVENKE